jgi:hypothetical protein
VKRNQRGFSKRSPSLYFHSYGNLVRSQQAASKRLAVWVPVVNGAALPGVEFRARADAEQAVLEALGFYYPNPATEEGGSK